MNFAKSILSVAVVSAFVAATTATSFAAGAASLNLSANGSATTGDTISVSVNESAASNATAITVKFVSDAGLQFVGGSCGATFGNYIAGTNGFTCYVAPGAAGVTGDAFVGTASFRANGSGTISTTTGSQVAASGVDQWNGVASSVSIAVSAPVAAAPVASTPAPVRTPVASSTPAASSSSSTAASTDQTAPATDQPAVATSDTKADTKKVAVAGTTNLRPVASATSPLTWFLVGALIVVVAGYLGRKRVVASSSAFRDRLHR